jgi:hypothetical protein
MNRKGSGRGLIEALSRPLHDSNEKRRETSVSITRVPTDIQRRNSGVRVNRVTAIDF